MDRATDPEVPASCSPTRSRRRAVVRAGAIGLALSLALGACGATGTGSSSPTSASPSTSTDGPAAPIRSASPAEVVRASAPLTAYERPDTGSPSRPLAATTSFGTQTALLVTNRIEGWVQVLVPGRPLGATAWLPDGGLDIEAVSSELHVDLSDRTLTLVEDGKVVLESPVAVGSDDSPTPVGRFSVTEKLQAPNPDDAYGPFAIGLSARSEVITEFAGGDGQIGIHGTNDPATIGQAVSHGCIRVPNDVVTELTRRLPLGTPVTVEA
jgi:hypothetical protein